jgi:inner membrane transporter RhtA
MPQSLALSSRAAAIDRVPPHLWFVGSAIFHYLGPSFAVLLFAHVGVLGVAWLRIASAAVVFALWRRPWRILREADRETIIIMVLLGACLAAMNSMFYLAISRLPLGLVAAIEFVGTIAVALIGLGTLRNYLALGLAATGVFILTDVRWASDALGLAFAAANGILFVIYIVLGHRVAQRGAGTSIDRLGLAMLLALLFVMPVGFGEAQLAFAAPTLLLAGIGVGVSSSVIPYVCDQLAMRKLPRNTYALMLAILPATATLIGALVLAQIPTLRDLLGIGLVMLGVAIHQQRAAGGEAHA